MRGRVVMRMRYCRPQAVATAGSPVAAPDIQGATTRYLMYGLLPAWVVPAAADWALHRRTRIEETAGVRESAIHLAMMAEVGVPAAAVLLCEVDPALLLLLASGAAAHEATGLWDVHTAQDAGREVSVVEQHVHSFLESLPLTALSILGCLHPDQVRALREGVIGRRGLRLRPRLRRQPLPGRYLAAVAAGTAVLGALYAEELWRCLRARKHSAALLRADAPGTAGCEGGGKPSRADEGAVAVSNPEEQGDPRVDEQARQRSAEQRNITSPTPPDVRAEAEDVDDDGEQTEPPAADTKAP